MSLNRKHATLLLTRVCLISVLLTACANVMGGISKSAPNVAPTIEGTPKAPYDQQVYHLPTNGISTLDPAVASYAFSEQAVSLVFNGLVQLDDNLQIQPELARSWEISSDGLRWTFHLYSQLTFSDGTPLTSKDVAYSLDRALQATLKSTVSLNYLGLLKDADLLYAGKIKTIINDSILTPDANTIVLTLHQKAAYFLYALTYSTSYVVEKLLIDKYGNDKFIQHLGQGGGSGPFIVSQYTQQEIDFAPNPYYYNVKPLLQKVVMLTVSSPDIAYSLYQNGQLDTTNVPPDRLDEARQLTNEYSQAPSLSTTYFAMNFLAKPFDNLYIRQAFALSINRETINDTVFHKTKIPTYHIIPQGMVGYNLNLTGPVNLKDSKGSIPLARQRFQEGLKEEGWSDVSQMPPIKLTYSHNANTDKIITMAIQMWQNALGVNITPDPVDFSTASKEIQATANNPKGLQMWYFAWNADYPDPQDWISLNFDKGAAWNDMNYGQNNTADALQEQQVQQQIEQADVEANPTTRLLLYQSAEQQIINQVGWIPLYQGTDIHLLKPYVKGVVPNPLGITPPSDWASIYIAAH
ncbi:MAG TPA: peptide ABC transporter substrate-binding protein [Ktedonobacteraceae bacterium]|nr:peptide ABC transporter substrate-binding protein [Ktedonobacteraceae bacterium]